MTIMIPTLVLDDAKFMGDHIIKGAHEMGISIACCTLDANGDVIYSFKQTGVKPASIQIAYSKAITALRNRCATLDFLWNKEDGGKGWSQMDVLNAQAANPLFIAWAGGIPLIVPSGVVAGAIAVSGGSEAQDHELVFHAFNAWNTV